MSRAINVNATEAHVTGMCAKHDAVITSIETLRSGGTRVVLTNGDSAARLRNAYGSKVITSAVRRQPMRVIQLPNPVSAPADVHPRTGAPSPWKARA